MQLFNRPKTFQSKSSKPIQEKLIDLIKQSNKGLKIAVTWFTNHDIFNAILDKLKQENYTVELVVLNDSINNKREGLDFQQLAEKADFYFSNVENMVHHKFCIIDGEILVTGSYNWTYYAENRNWENVLIIKNSEVVDEFREEFKEIIKQHKRVENVASVRETKIAINSLEYLQTDYLYQAKYELKRGNDFSELKVYDELRRLDISNASLSKKRGAILKKYNSELLTVTPFEVGILYGTGYVMAIPAYTQLPLPSPIIKGGRTTIEDQKDVHITIQKNEIVPQTILELDLRNIQSSPKGTTKIQHEFTIRVDGTLTVICKEVGGFGRTISASVNLKNCYNK